MNNSYIVRLFFVVCVFQLMYYAIQKQLDNNMQAIGKEATFI